MYHIHIALPLEVCASPEQLQAVLATIRESLPGLPAVGMINPLTPGHKKGPNESRWLALMGKERMRITDGSTDREAYAAALLEAMDSDGGSDTSADDRAETKAFTGGVVAPQDIDLSAFGNLDDE